MSDPQQGGPLAVMKSAAANGESTNPGYHDGKVTDTTHSGHPAALWEFTWNGFSTAEGPRHTYDMCWEENGRLYDVGVRAGREGAGGEGVLRRRAGHLRPGVRPWARNGR